MRRVCLCTAGVFRGTLRLGSDIKNNGNDEWWRFNQRKVALQ